MDGPAAKFVFFKILLMSASLDIIPLLSFSAFNTVALHEVCGILNIFNGFVAWRILVGIPWLKQHIKWAFELPAKVFCLFILFLLYFNREDPLIQRSLFKRDLARTYKIHNNKHSCTFIILNRLSSLILCRVSRGYSHSQLTLGKGGIHPGQVTSSSQGWYIKPTTIHTYG